MERGMEFVEGRMEEGFEVEFGSIKDKVCYGWCD